MVGVHARAVVVEHLFHANVRVVNRVLTHRGGSDASEVCCICVRVVDKNTWWELDTI